MNGFNYVPPICPEGSVFYKDGFITDGHSIIVVPKLDTYDIIVDFTQGTALKMSGIRNENRQFKIITEDSFTDNGDNQTFTFFNYRQPTSPTEQWVECIKLN